MIISAQEQEKPLVDITELFLKLKESNRNVFIYQADSQIFIYRPLGRSEYRKILTDKRFVDTEKEDLICQVCILYPENYDFDNCDAGIPTTLVKQILKNSYLDNDDSRQSVLDYYRSEMWDLDNQITCIINEAFPQFDIEDIEEWGVEKTTKYLSRAEWKLHNLRGLAFIEPKNEIKEEQKGADKYGNATTEELGTQEKRKKENSMLDGKNKKDKLTPQKLLELKRKFPNIKWDDDLGKLGVKGFEQASVDTQTPPALRPGF